MSRFLPSYTSPLLKPPPPPSTRTKPDDSRSSLASVPELIALTEEEIDFIDAVIERAPATATTFLTVFKAYNDLLQERGVDPQHEVVYYGKLLKLGTLKGKNWGEKWTSVKQQQVGVTSSRRSTSQPTPSTRPTQASTRTPTAPSYSRFTAQQSTPRPGPSTSSRAPISAPRAQALTRLTGALRRLERDEDAFTLHSHQDDQDAAVEAPTETDPASERNFPQVPRFVRHTNPSTTTTTATNSLGLTTGPPASALTPKGKTPLTRGGLLGRNLGWDGETSEFTAESGRTPSTIPPSYGAAVRGNDPANKPVYTPLRALAQAHSKGVLGPENSVTPTPATRAPATAREVVQRARERKGSVINEDDAWKKIRMARDEEDADRYRDERLVERCWEVWKQGYEWINNTNEQVAQARDNLLLRLAIHKWRSRLAVRYEKEQRAAKFLKDRHLKIALQIWKVKFRERRQAAWRDDMRNRMKMVRDSRDRKLKKDAWMNWRHSFKAQLSDQHFSERLVVRFFKRWRRKVTSLEQLDAAAEHFVVSKEHTQIERSWDVWRRAAEIRKAERFMTEKVSRRVLGEVMGVWKNRLSTVRIAEQFYDLLVMKRTMRSWKTAQERIRRLENRATKHLARQNDVLLLAVMRVWKAHERGKLLERVRTMRLLKQTWDVWMRRLRNQRAMEDRAYAFSIRTSSALASSTLKRWLQVYTTHRNAQAFAIHYHAAHLRFNVLVTWRLQLRAKLKLVKQAKVAEKKVIWGKWVEKVAQRKRERNLKEFEKRVVVRFFQDWRAQTQRQRELKLAESVIQQQIALRVMGSTLSRWTNTVADRKFRELEGTQMYERKITGAAFKKWKALCIRHVEELSLMESYQDIKREESMRRLFYRWLSAARDSRHRRLLVQKGEDEMKRVVLVRALNKWKEKYQEARLQPVAEAFMYQRRDNLVFRAFGIWHSKTRSLPAVRFHASHIKAHAWKVWRAGMPQALQYKAARETHNTSVLTKALEKWTQAYKTKMALKAVARARYLRLPTSAPRSSVLQSRPIPSSSSQLTSIFPRRPLRPSTPDSEASEQPVVPVPKPRPRPGIASLLSRNRSPDRAEQSKRTGVTPSSVSRPKLSMRGAPTRNSSPTRSEVSVVTRHTEPLPRNNAGLSGGIGEAGRSKLWQELRGLQMRSRAPTEKSVKREPP